MKRVRIVQDFEGYPTDDTARPRTFRVGDEVEVSAAYGALLVEKGHAREIVPAQAEAEAEDTNIAHRRTKA